MKAPASEAGSALPSLTVRNVVPGPAGLQGPVQPARPRRGGLGAALDLVLRLEVAAGDTRPATDGVHDAEFAVFPQAVQADQRRVHAEVPVQRLQHLGRDADGGAGGGVPGIRGRDHGGQTVESTPQEDHDEGAAGAGPRRRIGVAGGDQLRAQGRGGGHADAGEEPAAGETAAPELGTPGALGGHLPGGGEDPRLLHGG